MHELPKAIAWIGKIVAFLSGHEPRVRPNEQRFEAVRENIGRRLFRHGEGLAQLWWGRKFLTRLVLLRNVPNMRCWVGDDP